MDAGLGRMVALKVLTQEQAADPETLARFRNEARSAARLNHDNIVQVYHVGEECGLPYIVFEFIDGTNVRAMVEQRGPLPLAEALSYTFQVAEALAHAWSRNVVHRDIKPSNILVTREGQAKLIDMGLARLQRLDEEAADLTASGVTLGTFDYISPEQARDPRNADVRSDVYSLGCTLFFMLTGQPPFPAGTVLQKLLQHQGDEPPELRQLRPELPEEVSHVVRKMMAKDPRHRYQDPRKLMVALAALAEQVGLRPLVPGKPIWVSPHERPESPIVRHIPWMVPAGALLLAVMVLHLLWSLTARQGSAWSMAWLTPTDEPTSADESFLPAPETFSTDNTSSNSLRVGEELTAKPGATTFNPADKPAPEGAKDAPSGPADTVAKAPAETTGASPSGNGSGKAAGVPAADSPIMPASAPQPASSSAQNPAIGVPGAKAEGSRNEPGHAAPGSSTAEATAPVEASSQRAGVLVVDGQGQKENRFATLAAACSAASNNSVIELCYNGRQQERPLSITNPKLTIRSGEGFQPIVVFRPSEVDPTLYPREMITLNGGLVLINVSMELDIPQGIPAESWSLFDVSQAQSVQLERCWLTIRNASEQRGSYHPDVAFFRGVDSGRPGAPADGDSMTTAAQAQIRLTDCVVRGEAVLVRTDGLRPVELVWDNGLFATTEWLLIANPGDNAAPASPTIRVTLKHLTVMARGGLCQFVHSPFASQAVAAQINCTDSIILGASGGPLLEQVGGVAPDHFKQRITWSGDRNFYVSFGNLWSLRGVGTGLLSGPMALEAWRAHWGANENNVGSSVQWKQLPPADRPTNAHTPADYALSDSPGENPARKAASDGRDAGMDASRLPTAPQEPQTPEKTGQAAPAEAGKK